MKFLFSFLFLMVASWSLYAQTLVSVGLSTNKLVSVLTNSTAGTSIPVLGANKVSFFYKATGVSSNGSFSVGTGSMTFQFDVSADDVTYYKDNRYRFALALNDTATVSGWTNIGTQGYQYLRLSAMENPSTNGCFSNIVVQALVK